VRTFQVGHSSLDACSCFHIFLISSTFSSPLCLHIHLYHAAYLILLPGTFTFKFLVLRTFALDGHDVSGFFLRRYAALTCYGAHLPQLPAARLPHAHYHLRTRGHSPAHTTRRYTFAIVYWRIRIRVLPSGTPPLGRWRRAFCSVSSLYHVSLIPTAPHTHIPIRLYAHFAYLDDR